MKKRLLASILSLAMVFSLVPVSALAEDEEPGGDPAPVCTCEARCTEGAVDETCPVCAEDDTLCAFEEVPADEGEPTPCTVTEGCTLEAGHEGECVLPDEPEAPADGDKNDYYGTDDVTDPTVAEVQTLIDALPTAEDITVDNAEEVSAQLDAIDEAKSVLSEEQLEQLDFVRYAAAAEALSSLAGQPGANEPELLAEDENTYSVTVTVTETGKLSEAVEAALSDGKTVADITSLTIITEDGVYINKADCDWVKNNLRSAATNSETSAPGSLVRLDISQANFLDDSKKQSGENCGTDTNTVYYNRIPFEAFRGMGLEEVLPFSGEGSSTAPTKFTEIGDWAFRGNNLTLKLHIPENITYLSGFTENTSLIIDLSAGQIPASVTEIGDRAFSQCWAMNGDVVIPDTVTKIHTSAFYYAMKKADVGTQYNHTEKEKAGELTLSKNLTRIGSRAFIGDNALVANDLTLPNGVTSIGGGAFAQCSGLTGKLDLNNVTEIETYVNFNYGAFRETGFSEINFRNVQSIGEGAFANMPNLETLKLVSDTVTSIGMRAFEDNTALKTVIIDCPNFVQSDTSTIFNKDSSITAFDLNWSGKINNYTFSAAAGEITSIRIGNKVTELGTYVFYNTAAGHSIKAVDLTEATNLTKVGACTFSQMAAGGAIYLNNDVTFDTGALGSAASKIFVNGGVVDVTKSGFDAVTKDGYTAEWYKNSDFSGDSFTSAEADQTYYAKWLSTITFDANGGTGSMDAQKIAETDTNTALTTNSFTREGYQFSGWNTKPDGTGTAYAAGATGAGKDGNVTLYAQWTKKIGGSTSYTVNAIVDQTYTGAEIKPDVVVKNGDTVLSSGYTVTYADNTNVGTAKVTVAIGADTAEVEFRIVKDENPTVQMADVSVTYGTEYAMTATAQTSAGNEITGGAITIKYYTNETCSEGESETAPTNAGTYYAKATLTGTDNYAEASKVAKITISNATFSVTATGYSGTYDGTAHSIIVTADGADVTYSTDGTTYSSTNPTFTNAGTYTVYYKAEKANHDDVTGFVSVEITKALLTITADNQTVYVGGTLPEYTYTVSGLVGNDTEAVITTKPTMTCSAQDANTAGTYDITASSADAGNNYTIKYVDGTLTIADTGDGNAFKVETSALTSVPSSLSNLYETVTDLTTALKTEIRNANSSVSNSNIVVYDVTLMVNENGKWVKADKEHFPANGKLTVTLPYPDGTNSSYTFTVVHMFTTSDFDKTPGKTENPTVRNTANGIQFEVTGLSPISVGWTAPRSTGGGGGGSSSYNVSVDSGRNGSVSVSPKSAKKGDTVTITVKPDKGYEVDEIIVTDSKGNELKLTKKSDTRYTFTMPSGKVTVEASFAKIADAPDKDLAFVDVPANAYYADAVAWAVENGITSGTSDTTFSPNAACTRAQMMTFLWRAAGSPKAAGNNPFTDLDASAYYYDAVLWAVSEGITSGTSATTFSPDATVTRGQTVTFLYRANGSPTSSGNSFADVAHDAYYANAVAWAVSEGITSGTGNNAFSPDADCTRAQIVTFMYRNMA